MTATGTTVAVLPDPARLLTGAGRWYHRLSMPGRIKG